ncbi:MAG TPA: immunoglobulin domain-containing protein [Verrucomicrobiae bacterium]
MKTISKFLLDRCANRKKWLSAVVIPALALFIGGWLEQPLNAQTTYAVTNLFTDATGVGVLANSTSLRGMAYDPVSNLVYVAVASASASVVGAYDGTAGTSLGTFNVTGLSVGTFTLDQLGVAADGAIYGVNLSTASSAANKLYRWTNWMSVPTVAFNGNALANGGSLSFTSGRVGDSLAVSGSGANTLILAGVGTKPYFCLFYPNDGIGLSYTNTIIDVPSGLSIAGNVFGLCFYTNNTFLVKPSSSGNNTAYLIQYPANYASQSVVTGAVIATTSLGGSYNNTTMLSYSPNAGFLGVLTTGGNPSPLGLLNGGNIAGGVTSLATTNLSTPNSNGNATGGVALGGNGQTNVIYAYDTANSLFAYKIITVPPVAPGISGPVGGTVYPPYTLNVSVTGTSPYSYQWLATNAAVAGSFTNIPGATTNTYTITTASTNFYEVIVTNIAGATTSAVVLVEAQLPVNNSAVSSLWTVAPGQSGYSWLSSSDNNERGIAYDTNSQNVVVSATSGLYIINGNYGTNMGQLSLSGVTFGGLLGGCDQVGIADDGAVYGGNLINSGNSFTLYRWSSPTNSVTATQAFNGDPGNGNASSERWGDSIAVRGVGPTTQILLGSRASAPGGTNVALLTPNDGQGLTYSSQIIAVSGVPPGFSGGGISFGAGNTFWTKTFDGDLYEIAFNPTTLTGTVVFDYQQPSQVSPALIGVGVDPVNNILAGIQPNDTPNDLQLYELTGTSDPPVLFDQAFFTSANANGNENAVITVKYPRIYALDVNNGIVALTYGTPATTMPSINTPPVSTTAYANVASVTLSVSASGSLPLYYQWQFNSNDIPGATSSTYTITNPPLSTAGYYDVVVRNIAGTITSAPPALLTLVVPVTNSNVAQIWSIGPGTNSSVNGPYLTTSGYETRGLAYDSTTTNLLVADHYFIHDYNATNGSYQFDVNTAGLPTGGNGGWTVDQVGVADDGTLYSANLSLDGTGFSIITYGTYSYGSLNYAYGGSTGGSDLNTLDPLPDRWGDTMAVRGSGPNTQILFGSYNGTNVALFTTGDGMNFMPTLIEVPNVPLGFASLGITFGPGNTFYAKGGHDYNLRQISFNTNTVPATGTAIETYVAGSQVPNDLTGLGVDVTNNVLGGVCYNDNPNDLQLYLLSDNTNTPYLFEQDFFPANNGNAQQNSVVALKNGWGFALNVNNGIVAFKYSEPDAPSVTLTSVVYTPASTVINWNYTFDGHGYQVQYKTALLDPSWTPLGSSVTATNATASFTDTTAHGTTRFYRVISE